MQWGPARPPRLEPLDLNLPYILVGVPPVDGKVRAGCSSREGDPLRCQLQAQTAFQSVGITGSPFTLNYASDRTQGNVADRKLAITLTGATLPDQLQRVDLEIAVAGRRFQAGFAPAANLTYDFTWDGRDVYGRLVQGTQPVVVLIGYTFPILYAKPATGTTESFGLGCNQTTTALCALTADVQTPERMQETLVQELRTSIGTLDAAALGLGGFTVDVQHMYDPVGQIMYQGDGTRRAAAMLPPTIATSAGNGNSVGNPNLELDEIPATQSIVDGSNHPMAVAPDGSLYLGHACRVRKITPDGVIHHFAGSKLTCGLSPDSTPAATALFGSVSGLAVGTDGSVYISDQTNQRVWRVTPNGFARYFAGNGAFSFAGDGLPAVQASFRNPAGIAMGKDGSLYIADQGNNRVRRVAPDGIISTFAGSANVCGPSGAITSDAIYNSVCGNGVPAAQARLSAPPDVAIGPDGSVFIADGLGRVRRVTTDGVIRTFAGSQLNTSVGDGGLATLAGIVQPWGIAVGLDGSVYIGQDCASTAQLNACRVRRVSPQGIFTTFAGVGQVGFAGDGGPAPAALIGAVRSLAVGPEGDIYMGAGGNRIRRVRGFLPGFGAGQNVIASDDGSELHVFSSAGRILLTISAFTRDTLFTFSYNGARQLVSITDRDGQVTELTRDSTGAVTDIVGPNGQQTLVASGAQEINVTGPNGQPVRFSLNPDGLLSSMTDENGHVAGFAFDSIGLLDGTTTGGGSQQIVALAASTGNTIDFVSPEQVSATLLGETFPIGGQRATVILADGSRAEATDNGAGVLTTRHPDGTVVTSQERPHPLYGMQAPLQTASLSMPSGLTYNSRVAAAVTTDDVLDEVLTETDSTIVNGRATVTVYNHQTGVALRTSPAGRRRVAALDSAGRVVRDSTTGVASLLLTYDSAGRLKTWAQGSRAWRVGYDEHGRTTTVTAPTGLERKYLYDGRDRVALTLTPRGDTTRLTYDSARGITSVTPPSRPAHRFTYTATDQLETYEPPDIGDGKPPMRFSYDLDGRLRRLSRSNGDSVVFVYDSVGRTAAIVTPDGPSSFSYDATTGQLHDVIASSGSALTFGYDGALNTRLTWGGATVGSVSKVFDNDMRPTSQSVNDAQTVTYGYDVDGLVTSVGEMTLTRDPDNGRVSSTTIGGLVMSYLYDAFGVPSRISAVHAGDSVFNHTYTRDSLGRVATLSETVVGTTTAVVFAYDSAGRLAWVTRNGVPDASYEYDPNGNRVRVTTAAGVVFSSFDARDRLLTNGNATYTHTADGELAQKVVGTDTTTFRYSARGELVEVDLPSADVIQFVYDGAGRRVGKKVNGVLVQAWLFDAEGPPVAELNGLGQVVGRFVYAGRQFPDYVVRDGRPYRVITDYLGSVRLVVDVQSGQIVQRIDYDAYGRITLNSNPGFQPFGFAGGLFDEHTGLVRLGLRDYDAEAGRWTTRDPVLFAGGGSNLYEYAVGDPVNGSDPSGLVIGSADLVVSQTEREKMQAAGARQAHQTYRTMRRLLCKPIDFLASRLENAADLYKLMSPRKHHPSMQSIFGPNSEIEVILSIDHDIFHSMFDAALKMFGISSNGHFTSGDWWKMNPTERRQAADLLVRVSEIFDKACAGTRGYKKIAPRIREALQKVNWY